MKHKQMLNIACFYSSPWGWKVWHSANCVCAKK